LIDWSSSQLHFQTPLQTDSLSPTPSPKPLSNPPVTLPPALPLPLPLISLVSAASFACACKLDGSQCYVLRPPDTCAHVLSTISTDISTQNYSPHTKELPLDYNDFLDVFNENDASHLPEHHTYDHRIMLEEGTTPPWGPLYSLSEMEQQAIQKYLDEHLSKGWIRQSSSPAGAPILFI
jgi:hypothetical protein